MSFPWFFQSISQHRPHIDPVPLILSQANRQSDSFKRLFNNGLALNGALFGLDEILSKTSLWLVICQYRLWYFPTQARDTDLRSTLMLKIFQGLCTAFIWGKVLPEAKPVPMSSVRLDCGSQLENKLKMGNFFFCYSILVT